MRKKSGHTTKVALSADRGDLLCMHENLSSDAQNPQKSQLWWNESVTTVPGRGREGWEDRLINGPH